jgi:acyl carrier protein
MPTIQIEPCHGSAGRRGSGLRNYGEGVRHLSVSAQAAFTRFQHDGDPATLDPIMFDIVEHFAPAPPAQPLAGLPGSTRLVEDLGFDSLTMVEIVFFIEELFGVSVTNAEVIQVRTVDHLRTFLRHKLSARLAAGRPSSPTPHV